MNKYGIHELVDDIIKYINIRVIIIPLIDKYIYFGILIKRNLNI